MAEAFELSDAVWLSQDGRKLEGVIAWRGPWAAAAGADWVGVRLTGASAGLGATDGTVEGTEYFACPPNCGVFAPLSAVTKRRLTRLEELRLKRELAGGTKRAAGGATGSSSASTASTTTTPTTTPQKPAAREAKASPVPAAARAEGKTGMSKLEELRQRRAALNEKKDTVKATLSTPPPARKAAPPAAVPSAATEPIASPAAALEREGIRQLNAELGPLQAQLASLQAQLGDKDKEVASLKSELSAKEAELEKVRTTPAQTKDPAATNRLAELEGKLRATERELQETRSKLEQASPAVVVSRATGDSDERLAALESSLQEWKEKAGDALSEITNLRNLLEQEKKTHETSKGELTVARADLARTDKELEILKNQIELRGTTDNSHYKERAKLQAEISSQKRKVELLEKEKMDMEATIEDLALDKEQLLQEKESLEDRCDELRLDAETAQLAVEELKIELEDVRRVSSEVAGTSQVDNMGDAEERAAALSTQNARLREALIRLREQSQAKDMEHTRQIRAAEKEVESAKALTEEVRNLRATKALYEEQISELKDVVEQGSSFEQMVEDLSDKLLSIEEENNSLRSVLREMEEAAELSAEVEEVQADELKALNRDLEGRDSIIHNLEEAIKIQRRREEDFLRSVANYRTTVATLNQEKQSLLDLYQGTEGEKSNLVAASQGALARASQLVSDAAAMREREALGTLDKVDKEVFKNLALRLEGLLPRSLAGLEVSAIKGELLASKIIDRGSKILECINVSLAKFIRPSLVIEKVAATSDIKLDLSDEVRQKFDLILFQSQLAQTIIEGSSELTRILVAIQWPDLLPEKLSAEASSIIYHSVGELDIFFGAVLKSAKEEGEISPEHVNVSALRQIINTTMASLRGEIERIRAVLLPASWNPPGWTLMRDSSSAKFACQGAAAALSLILSESADLKTQQGLALTYETLEKTVAQASSACNRLCSLDIMSGSIVSELTLLADEWKRAACDLVDDGLGGLLSGGGMDPLTLSADTVLQTLMKFSSTLRSANLATNDSDEMFHALSPESDHSWEKLTALCRLVRSVDGDEDDINYIIRSRAIESRIAEAIENEEKLSSATVKIANLETSLAKKSTEVSLQIARLSELEKEIAKGSAVNINRAFDLKSSDEFKRLTEENRVLQDALQYWQNKAEEQDAAMNDMKSPTGKVSRNRPPSMMSPSAHSTAVGRPEDVGLLEATLFRPALQQVLRDASKWKAAAIASQLQDLPPLHISASLLTIDAAKSNARTESLLELASAQSNFRVVQASYKLVDLTNTTKSPRAQLVELSSNYVLASERLQAIVSQHRSILA